MKEKVIISYGKGITHSPSDILCNDGDLEDCVNLEVKNGELSPTEMPSLLELELGVDERLILVHNTKLNDKNYVVSKGNVVKILNGGTNEVMFTREIGEIKSIQFIGNSIVVYTADSPHYILYTDGEYKYLGSKIPEIGLSFDLIGSFETSEVFEFHTPDAEFTSDEFQEAVCSSIVPEVNKFIEEKATATGRFMYPFFVRYAIRMFDGSYTMHSSPVLMLPSTNISPFVSSYMDMVNYGDKDVKAQVGGFVARLEATISDISGSLSYWSDVISSVDIFVSKQITTYDQNGTKFGNAALSSSKFVGKFGNNSSTIWDAYSLMVSNIDMEAGENENLNRWYIPSRDIEEVNSEIGSTSLFYKYASLNVSELSGGVSEILNGNLSALEVNESLSDDYMTHDVFVPESSFVYNGRLNISNVKRKLFGGFPVHCMVQMVKHATSDGFDYNLTYGRYKTYTYIKSSNGGGDIVVESELSEYGALYSPYLFYPDSDAYKMIIVDTTNNMHAEVGLTEHPLLNGAFYFGGFQSLSFSYGGGSVSVTSNEEIQANKLYVSNVNNLFHFPLEGIYTVGSDRIIGMGALTRPISQGQFGEFPLIVFCSDGNYAMRVDEQGYYTSISPVQEDIVLGNDKITPMENSILVITKKGIMLTSGAETTKIASFMEGGFIDSTSLDSIKTTISGISTIVEKSKSDEGFLSYVYGSRMAFDYASNRVLIYNPDKTYSYLYSFESDTVSKIVLNGGSKIVTSVIDYPDTIIQDETGKLYSLYAKEDVSLSKEQRFGFALTRPLKMGAAMNMKAVRQLMSIATHGKDSYVKYLLYGSNDNSTYYKVSSRFGKPYKYYRVAIYTSLLPKESFSGAVMTVEERRTHKLR